MMIRRKRYINYTGSLFSTCLVHPRSNNPARKRPVPWYSGDFMESCFRNHRPGLHEKRHEEANSNESVEFGDEKNNLDEIQLAINMAEFIKEMQAMFAANPTVTVNVETFKAPEEQHHIPKL
ncbi:unnamed protein product [Adineta ricciae]|uniref:Uncharacterized protein n=1 Tax=Adineta ricciae TaxID=249248 RepID=A0A815UJW5_ADIRI|nr:unnamed protein product [Adineta ricciae]CAF1518135.1 unnamed protein product [Adineta ricciae]